jgi:ferri-bacillibactin esterase
MPVPVRKLWLVMLLFSAAVGCSSALEHRVDGRGRASSAPVAYLAGTESRIVTSFRTGRGYQVSVALPRGYEGFSSSYPVLYALDANGEFGIVVETARLLQLERLVPELVIVGIGYPVGHFYDALGKRVLDLTTTPDAKYEEIYQRTFPFPPPDGTGGAAEFLRFLRDDLVPLVEAEYRVDGSDRGLVGHSFGGSFPFHALLHGDGVFRRFIISSPALWWGERDAFADEAAHAAAHDELRARAFFSVGLLDQDAPVEGVPWGGFITNLRDLVAILEQRKYRGFESTAVFFDGETHNSVVPASISRGLRYVYGMD